MEWSRTYDVLRIKAVVIEVEASVESPSTGVALRAAINGLQESGNGAHIMIL